MRYNNISKCSARRIIAQTWPHLTLFVRHAGFGHGTILDYQAGQDR